MFQETFVYKFLKALARDDGDAKTGRPAPREDPIMADFFLVNSLLNCELSRKDF